MKILVLDNYDSFVFNLVHYIKELGYHDLEVHRNDRISLEAVAAYDKILLSPGPGIPEEAGIMLDLIRQYAPSKSIFGVCLGHQAIGEVFGAQLHNMAEPLHGIAQRCLVTDPGEKLFQNMPADFMVCRYHSWTVLRNTMSGDLAPTASDEQGNVMALAHKKHDIRGVQFHPESILTEHGKQMLTNWLEG